MTGRGVVGNRDARRLSGEWRRIERGPAQHFVPMTGRFKNLVECSLAGQLNAGITSRERFRAGGCCLDEQRDAVGGNVVASADKETKPGRLLLKQKFVG